MATLGTFTAGQVLTAAELNQLNNVTVLRGGATTINHATETTIEFDQAGEVIVDTSNWHSTSVNPSRITVDKNGIYLVGVYAQFVYVSTEANFSIQLKQNGATKSESAFRGTTYPSGSAVAMLSATANDYFTLVLYQDSGVSVSIFDGRISLYAMLLRTT